MKINIQRLRETKTDAEFRRVFSAMLREGYRISKDNELTSKWQLNAAELAIKLDKTRRELNDIADKYQQSWLLNARYKARENQEKEDNTVSTVWTIILIIMFLGCILTAYFY